MMQSGSRAPVLVIGAVPPPTHGYAAVTAAMIEELRAVAPVEVAPISPDTLERGPRYHLQRLTRVGCALLKLISWSRRQHRTAYLAISGGAGVVYDLLLAFAARVLGYRLFIHHHAFSYIDRRSRWTAALVAVTGSSARHICLCPAMARLLGETYPRVKTVIVQSNAAFVSPAMSTLRAPAASVRLGFLSNLTPEKGLDTAIDVFRALHERSEDVAFVVAGPTPSPIAQSLLEEAKLEFGAALDYRGPVYGMQKAEFFRDIDVFLFPSRYANEAEPLVVLEALASGVPVLAIARGCIAHTLSTGGAAYDERDYLEAAVTLLESCISDRSRLATLSDAAHDQAIQLHESAHRELDDLVTAITSPGYRARTENRPGPLAPAHFVSDRESRRAEIPSGPDAG